MSAVSATAPSSAQWQVTSNWSSSLGRDMSCLLSVTPANFERPKALDDFLSDETTVILEKTSCSDPCEVLVKSTTLPRENIKMVTLVCSCKRLEVFVNDWLDYLCIINGDLIDDLDVPSYRYDISFKKPVHTFQIKCFPTSDEMWLFGMNLSVSQTDGTSSGPRINELLPLRSENIPPSLVALMAALNSRTSPNSTPPHKPVSPIEESLAKHIDTRFQMLETRLMHKMEALCQQHDAKLERIIKLLEGT